MDRGTMAVAAALCALASTGAGAQTKYYARQPIAPPVAAATTYSWQSGSTDAGCSVGFGRRVLVSTATCKGSDGSTAPDAKCTGTKPAAGATTYGSTCTSTVDCTRQSYSNRSGIQSESSASFTAASAAEGVLECARISNVNHRIGTCTFVGGSSWRIYLETNGTQSATGQTSWPCAAGYGSVP